MVITWHEVWGDYWYKYMGKFGFFGKAIECVASKLGHKSIVVSVMTENNLELLGVGSGNIRIIPNGVDLRYIDSIRPSENKCDIIFIGRLIKEKNVDVLIETVCLVKKNFPDVQCHIIGDGPEKGRLIELIIKYGLLGTVRFLNFMEYDEVIARIKSSKMLILPSSREGFGMVVMEAFACGIPVITVNEERNAASELVNGETGFVTELKACRLSHAINVLMDRTDGDIEKMSKSAIDKAGVYDWDTIAEHLIHFYSGIVSK
jgi:glycosyltransferase involved in cell wall biosynthesis